MSDATTTLQHLRQQVAHFVSERDWEVFHTPKSLSMSISIEAAELMELFQWYGNHTSRRVALEAEVHAALADELADVLIYALALANVTEIDVSEAVLAKLARNQQRFPPGQQPSRRRSLDNAQTHQEKGNVP